MNKRLKELIEQAAINTNDRVTNTSSDIEKDQVFMQEFAHLIVKDIILIVEGYCETSPEIWGLPLDILEHFEMELKDDE